MVLAVTKLFLEVSGSSGHVFMPLWIPETLLERAIWLAVALAVFLWLRCVYVSLRQRRLTIAVLAILKRMCKTNPGNLEQSHEHVKSAVQEVEAASSGFALFKPVEYLRVNLHAARSVMLSFDALCGQWIPERERGTGNEGQTDYFDRSCRGRSCVGTRDRLIIR